MRIRSTKPEFWRSERIASVDWSARLVLKGLESYVDDNGVGKDDLALIVADVFPRDLSRNPPGTLQKVSEAIGSLHRAGLLWRYEVDGTKLLYVAFWESVQRIDKPSAGRFRRPDGTKDYRESEIRESFPEPSRNTPGTLPPGTGEQGNRGTDGIALVRRRQFVVEMGQPPEVGNRGATPRRSSLFSDAGTRKLAVATRIVRGGHRRLPHHRRSLGLRRSAPQCGCLTPHLRGRHTRQAATRPAAASPRRWSRSFCRRRHPVKSFLPPPLPLSPHRFVRFRANGHSSGRRRPTL